MIRLHAEAVGTTVSPKLSILLFPTHAGGLGKKTLLVNLIHPLLQTQMCTGVAIVTRSCVMTSRVGGELRGYQMWAQSTSSCTGVLFVCASRIK